MFEGQKEKYIYWRQYLLALRFIESFGNWQHIQVSQDYFLTAKSRTADDVFAQIADKYGRFVTILKVDDDLRIFSDAYGLR